MIEHTETDGTDDIGPHVLVPVITDCHGSVWLYEELWDSGVSISEPEDR